MPLRKYWTTVRDSLWFIPALWVIASAILAFGMITIDRRTPEFAASFPLVFGGGAEGARGLLSSIAGSMITVAGVTFSITIVALQLASSQLSPRVLRNFMSDRSSQVVLGAFIGAFTYSILVLRSIRSEQDDIAAFVPSVAVSVGIGFSLVALGMFVYFIHHIASRIQLSSIVGKIADETTEQVRSEWTEADENAGPAGLPDEEPGYVTADGSGYLQLMDFGQLHEIATEHLIVIRVEVKLGAWVQEDAPALRGLARQRGRGRAAQPPAAPGVPRVAALDRAGRRLWHSAARRRGAQGDLARDQRPHLRHGLHRAPGPDPRGVGPAPPSATRLLGRRWNRAAGGAP